MRFVALLALMFLLAACDGSEGEDEAATVTAAPSTVTASTAATPTPVIVTTTQVIGYVAPPPSGQSQDGSCFGPSLSATRPDAWRCTVGNRIHDPCFGDLTAALVVCPGNPTLLDQQVWIRLTTPLSAVNRPAGDGLQHPWFMQTETGAFCGFFTGATGVINGDRINYGCTDDTQLVGLPAPGEVWTARQVKVDSLPAATPVGETIVKLVKVWQ